MRILALTTSYPRHPEDGTAPFIRAITLGMAAQGAQLDVVLPHHPDLRWQGRDGPVALHAYRYAPPLRALHRWGYAGGLQADRRLHVVTLAIAPFAALAARRALAGVARGRSPDVVHAHWLVPNGVVAHGWARRHRTPLVVSLHGSDVFLAERARWLHGASRRTLNAAAAITACSEDLADRAVRLGAPRERVHVVPYGVDVDTLRPADAGTRRTARAILVPDDRPVLLGVGRLVAKKGFDILLDAIALLPAADRPRVVLAGDGDLRRPLADQAARSGVELHFAGALDRGALRQWYAAADVLVVPSVVDRSGNVDGLPNVALEGLAAGVPLIASRVGGLPDVLTHDVTAHLVAPGDAAALAGAVLTLLGDAPRRARLADAARQLAVRDLAWPIIVARFMTIVRQATT